MPLGPNPAPSRRTFLTTSAAAALAPLLANWSRAATTPAAKAKAKSVILIFNCGAPSHLDLFDPKPDAEADVRGPFSPIRTNVPGVHVTELLPQLARRMDKLTLIRSVHHEHSSHNAGMYWAIAGRPYRVDSTLIHPSRSDLPGFGTLCGWLARKDGYTGSTPPYVITPFPHCDSKVYITPGQFGGCLGAQYDPFILDPDPRTAGTTVQDLTLDPAVSKSRFADRMSLLNKLAGHAPAPIPSPLTADIDAFSRQAADMLGSGKATDAFDLSKEPPAVRERYGRHPWGQSHLLARRLVEAGTKFVTCVNGPSITWDTHQNNFTKLKDTLVPPMEQAYAALLDDLAERRLLDSTLVVWMGEFGRTPKVNKDAGRDHWPGCYTVALAGGGVQGGQVIGGSDAIGMYPKDRPTTPADLHATVFKLLGHDPRGVWYPASDGRPIPLTEGTPMRELVS